MLFKINFWSFILSRLLANLFPSKIPSPKISELGDVSLGMGTQYYCVVTQPVDDTSKQMKGALPLWQQMYILLQ